MVLSCLGLDILQLAKIVINSSPVFRQRPPTTAAAQEGGGERKRERERENNGWHKKFTKYKLNWEKRTKVNFYFVFAEMPFCVLEQLWFPLKGTVSRAFLPLISRNQTNIFLKLVFYFENLFLIFHKFEKSVFPGYYTALQGLQPVSFNGKSEGGKSRGTVPLRK